MDQLDIAVHQTAHDAPGGLPALAVKMGKRESTLRGKVCQTTDEHKLTLREALAMMELTGDDRILFVMAEARGYTLQRKALPDAVSLVAAVLDADAEHGDVAQQIRAAIADGKLTEAEKARITNEINEAASALETLRSTIVRAQTQIGRAAP